MLVKDELVADVSVALVVADSEELVPVTLVVDKIVADVVAVIVAVDSEVLVLVPVALVANELVAEVGCVLVPEESQVLVLDVDPMVSRDVASGAPVQDEVDVAVSDKLVKEPRKKLVVGPAVSVARLVAVTLPPAIVSEGTPEVDWLVADCAKESVALMVLVAGAPDADRELVPVAVLVAGAADVDKELVPVAVLVTVWLIAGLVGAPRAILVADQVPEAVADAVLLSECVPVEVGEAVPVSDRPVTDSVAVNELVLVPDRLVTDSVDVSERIPLEVPLVEDKLVAEVWVAVAEAVVSSTLHVHGVWKAGGSSSRISPGEHSLRHWAQCWSFSKQLKPSSTQQRDCWQPSQAPVGHWVGCAGAGIVVVVVAASRPDVVAGLVPVWGKELVAVSSTAQLQGDWNSGGSS